MIQISVCTAFDAFDAILQRMHQMTRTFLVLVAWLSIRYLFDIDNQTESNL